MSNIELSKICQTLNCINFNIGSFPYQPCVDRLMLNYDRNKEALKDKVILSHKVVN